MVDPVELRTPQRAKISLPHTTEGPVHEHGEENSKHLAGAALQNHGSAVSSPSNGRKSVVRGLPALLPLSLIVLSVLIFSHEMIFSDKIPLFRDLGPFFYPMRFSLAESLIAGELPLWNRHMGLGYPLLANFQSGTFYPPNLIFALVPFFTAIKTIFIFHYLVAAIGAYFVLRYWGFTQPLAFVGALLFTFGGYTISLTNLLNHFQTVVWLPWLLLLGEKQLRSSNWSNSVLSVLVATVQFLAGSPEIYALSMALLLINGLRVKGESQISYARILTSFVWVNTLVMGLAMIQVLPTLELLREAERTQATSLSWATGWSLHPLNLLNLLFLDKKIDFSSFDNFQFFFYRRPPLLASLYMGCLLPFGLWAWIVSEDNKRKAILLGGIVIFLLLSMGGHTPLYGLFYNYFPFFSIFRFPEKFFFIPFVLFLYVTLRGLSYLLNNSEARSLKILLGPMIVAGFLLGVYVLFRSHRTILLQFIASTAEIPSDHPLTWKISSTVLVHLERQIVLLLGLLVLFVLWQRRKIRQRLMTILIVSITCIDLYSAHISYQLLMDTHVVQQRPKMLDLLEDFPSYRVFFTSRRAPFHPDIVQFPKAKSPREHVSFAFETLRPNMGIFWGVNYMQEVDALLRRPYELFQRVAPTLAEEKFYSLLGVLNVKYLISLQELPRGPITLIHHSPEYPAWIYRVDRVVPRAYIVPKAIYEKDPEKTIEKLVGSSFDPIREVVVDEPLLLSPKGGFKEEVKIVAHTNRSVRLMSSSNRPGILVLSDSFYPGWQVYVDGDEKNILRANYFFRGVYVPEGEHEVVFRYAPTSFRIGMIVSLSTLASLILGFILLRYRSQRRQACGNTGMTE